MNDPIQIFVCTKYCLEEVLFIIVETDNVTSAKVFLQTPDDRTESEDDSCEEDLGELSVILAGSKFRAMLKRK